MATTTLSRIDELEENDRRFFRQPNGRLRSNFSAGGTVGADWVRKYDTYLEDMRKDAANWRREGNLPAAERAENQVMWETAERQSTHASKRFHENSNPDEKSRFHERMLEADRDADMAEQRQFQSDKTHDSQRVETRERQQREHQEAQRQADAERQAAEDTKKPLRERLQGQDLERYNRAHADFNKGMKPVQCGQGEYLDDPGHNDWFDQRYEALLKERANAKTTTDDDEPTDSAKAKRAAAPAEDAQAAPAKKQAGEGQGEQAEQPEAHAADGKQHSPLLKQHQGYRAQVADDQHSISYHKGDSEKASFIDYGNRVSMSPDTYKDDPEALRAALRHADEKFERFSINGLREHQEASARMAERMGLGSKVANQDLQDVIAKERELMAKEQAQREGGQKQSGDGDGDGQKAAKPADSTTVSESASTRQAESGTRTLDSESESGAQSKAAESDSQRAESAPAASDSSKAGQPARPAEAAKSSAADKPSDDLPKPPGYDAAKASGQREKASEAKEGLSPPPGDKSAGQSEKPAGARLK